MKTSRPWVTGVRVALYHTAAMPLAMLMDVAFFEKGSTPWFWKYLWVHLLWILIFPMQFLPDQFMMSGIGAAGEILLGSSLIWGIVAFLIHRIVKRIKVSP